jgi:hypothetical protein
MAPKKAKKGKRKVKVMVSDNNVENALASKLFSNLSMYSETSVDYSERSQGGDDSLLMSYETPRSILDDLRDEEEEKNNVGSKSYRENTIPEKTITEELAEYEEEEKEREERAKQERLLVD